MQRRARNIMGLFVLVGTFIALSDRLPGGTLKASEACSCSGYAYGHQYSGGYVGSEGSGIFYIGQADTYLQCALTCQNWIWDVGSSVCTNYSLRNGVGYVVLDWYWFLGSSSDHYTQPYDCDDL